MYCQAQARQAERRIQRSHAKILFQWGETDLYLTVQCQIMSNLNCRRQTYNLKQLKGFMWKQK